MNMAQGKLITRKEAADYLGVCPDTIVNMIKRGILHNPKTGDKAWYLYRDEVVSIGAVNASHIENKFNEVKQLQEDLNAEQERLRQELKTYKELSVKSEEYKKITNTYISNIEYFWKKVIPDCNTRNIEILQSFVNGTSRLELSENYGLKSERVRQIIEKELRKIRYRLEYYFDLEYQLKDSESIIYNLQTDIKVLNRIIENITNQVKEKDIELQTLKKDFEVHNYTMKLLDNPKLSEMDFSKRAMNVFNSLEIETLKELLTVKKEDLLKFRNIGVKTIYEIEQILKERGLTLA